MLLVNNIKMEMLVTNFWYENNFCGGGGVILFTPLLCKIPILMYYFNIPKQENILCF